MKTHALPRKRPVQDHLPRRPAALPDPAGPHRDRRCCWRSPSSWCRSSASEYLFRAILIPFLILSLAALGLNILVGYCGQISLGTGAFMAVGAYAAYNFAVRIAGMPLIVALLLGGVCATVVGVLFGIPSLRIKGLYLAVATLAAQFFVDWAFLRIKWFTNDSSSGSVGVADLKVFGWPIDTPAQNYLFCLAFVVRVRAAGARTWCAAHIGREWMAIARHGRRRRGDRHPPGVRQALAPSRSARSSSAWPARCGASSTWARGSRPRSDRPLVPAAVHGDHRRAGLDHGQLLRRRVHRDPADLAEPAAAGSAVRRHPRSPPRRSRTSSSWSSAR